MPVFLQKSTAAKLIAGVLIAFEAVASPAAACEMDWMGGCVSAYTLFYGPGYTWGAYSGYPYYDYNYPNFYDLRNRCYRYGGYQIYEVPCYPYYPN